MNPTPASGAAATISVMIVDDHEVVRRGIAEIVERADGMTVVAEAGSVAEGIRRAALVQPHVILCDLRLPESGSFARAHRIEPDRAGAAPLR